MSLLSSRRLYLIANALLCSSSIYGSTEVAQCADEVSQANAPLDAFSMLQVKRPEEELTIVSEESSASDGSESSSRGLPQNAWKGDKQRFEFAPDADFMYTWQVSGTGPVNVTASDATRASGPLSVLLMLQRSIAKQGLLASRVENARKVGHLELHLVGVNPDLEPMMPWDQFLVGPLSPEFRRLVNAFNLPETPFAGMNVSLLYNCFNNDCKWHKKPAQFPMGYSEAHVFGPYHDVVSSVPDFVFMSNPGFSHYPQSWGKTLQRLRSNGAPVIATGYGDNTYLDSFGHGEKMKGTAMDTIYEFDSAVSPTLHGDGQTLQLPPAELVGAGLDSFGLKHKVDVLKDSVGRSIKVHHCPLQLEDLNLCGDLGGNAFVADRIGYSAQVSEKNPFAYCDFPKVCMCSSGSIIHLLEPKPVHHDVQTPDALLYRDVVQRCAGCLSDKDSVVSCMQTKLDGAFQPGHWLQRHYFPYVRQGYTDGMLKEVFKSCSD